MMDYTLIPLDVEIATLKQDLRREIIFEALEDVAPEVFDDPDLGPEIAAGDSVKMLEIAESLMFARKVDGEWLFKKRSDALRALEPVLRDLHHASPTVDEVAVNRALGGDQDAYLSLTPREKRAFIAAVARLGWAEWRYGAEGTPRDVKRMFGANASRGAGINTDGHKAAVFGKWDQTVLERLSQAVARLA